MARSQRTNILSFSLIMIVISCYLMKYLPVLVIIYYFAYLFSSLCFLSFFGISFFFSFLFIFILTLTHIRGYLKCVRTVQNAVWELLCKSGSWWMMWHIRKWLIGGTGCFIVGPADVSGCGSTFISWLVTSERVSLNLFMWKETLTFILLKHRWRRYVTCLCGLRKEHRGRGYLISIFSQFL